MFLIICFVYFQVSVVEYLQIKNRKINCCKVRNFKYLSDCCHLKLLPGLMVIVTTVVKQESEVHHDECNDGNIEGSIDDKQ